MLGETVFFSA